METKKHVGRPTNASIRNKKMCKMILILFVIIIVFLLGYFTNDLVNEEEKEPEIKEQKKEQENKITSKLLIENCFVGESQSSEFIYDNITYKLNFQSSETGPQEVLLNNKKIFEMYGPEAIDQIYSFGDLLVIFIISSGTRGQMVKFIDFEGNEIKTISEIYYNNLAFDLGTNNISFIDNKIVLPMTAVGEGYVLVTKDYESLDEEETMPYSDSFKVKYNITDETIVEATFSIEYLGNKIFEEKEVSSATTYKEFIEKNY